MDPRGIPDDKDFVQSLSHAIGFLAVQFGLFEFSLNGTIAIIHHRLGQPISGRGQLPYMLKERLRYMRGAAARMTVLEPYRSELLTLMTTAKMLSKTRNGVLHGYPADYDEKTRLLMFINMAPGRDKRMHQEARFIIPITELLDHGLRAEKLATQMGTLCSRLIREFAP